MSKISFIPILTLVATFIACDDSDIQQKTDGVFSGTISSVSGEDIYPSYIISGDSLLAIVSDENSFSIELPNGEYGLTYSAIGYSDQMLSLTIDGDVHSDIILSENNETGRVYGEFQDLARFKQESTENSELITWTEKQIFDGVTGATILENNSTTNFEQAQLFIGDSLMEYADVYGQYWINIQCGTYPITGVSLGFADKTNVIIVEPDSKEYINFFMSPE